MKNLGALTHALKPYCDEADLIPQPLSYPKERVRVIPFKDKDGYVQALTFESDLMDVEQLNLATNRILRVLSCKQQLSLLRQLKVERLTPVPSKPGNWNLIVDRKVIEADFVEIAIDNEVGVQLPVTALLKVFPTHSVGEIGINIDESLRRRCEDGDVNACIRTFTKLKIKRRLDETLEIPPLSTSARKLMVLRSNPNANLNDLVDIIENDPSLSANIIRWSNSPLYNHAGKVSGVQDAVGRVLGFDLVMNLAMGLTLGGVIEKPKDHPDGFMCYWQQSIWMSYASAMICSCIPIKERPSYGLVYLSGLLHNFGYLILNHVFNPYFKILCRQWEANTHVDPSLVEMKNLGITRDQIAADLFAIWDMPEEVVVAIREQKTKDYDGSHASYVTILKAARALLGEIGLPTGVDWGASRPHLEVLNVNMDLLEERLERLVDQKSQIESMARML